MLAGGGGFSAFTTVPSRPQWQNVLSGVARAGDVLGLVLIEGLSKKNDESIAHGDAPLVSEFEHLVIKGDRDADSALSSNRFRSAPGLTSWCGHGDTVRRF